MPSSGMQPVPDPYRVLGVVRGASLAQIKAAHRSLAKRYHPDATDGDTKRFLAVQAAYVLLSDPLRRREWDARHEPGPVRAGEGTVRGRQRAASGRWTRENPEAGPKRGTRRGAESAARDSTAPPGGAKPRPGRPAPPNSGPSADPTRARPRGGADATGDVGSDDPGDERRRDPAMWSASGRDPSTRQYTWTAERVPWWEDFPGARGAPAEPGAASPPGDDDRSPRTPRQPGKPAGPPADGGASATSPVNEFDVYNRSSGAAWSSAARRFFREADGDLPSRGVFRRQGSQYVTGAKARQVADAEGRANPSHAPSAPRRAGPAPTPPPDSGPRQGADARSAPDIRSGSDAPSAPDTRTTADHRPIRQARPMSAAEATGAPPPRPSMGTTTWATHARQRTAEPLELTRRLSEVALAWMPLAAVVGWGAPAAACDAGDDVCASSLAPTQAIIAVVLLAVFVALPRLARIGALATVTAIAVAVPVILVALLLRLTPPATPIMAGAAVVIVAAYLAGGVVAALMLRGRKSARG